MHLMSCLISSIMSVTGPPVCPVTKSKGNKSTSNPSVRKSSSADVLELPSRLSRSTSAIPNSKSGMRDTTLATTTNAKFEAIDELTDDSGFQSSRSVLKNNYLLNNSSDCYLSLASSSSNVFERSQQKEAVEHNLPSTVALVAGSFLISFFHIKDSTELSQESVNQPLFAVTIEQPSFIRQQNVYDVTTHISIYQCTLALPQKNTATQKGDQPEEEQERISFSCLLLDAKPGKVPDNTGIPPPLFTYNSQCTKKQQLLLDIEFKRPIELNLSEIYLKQLCHNMLLVYAALLEEPCYIQRLEKPMVRGSKLQLLRMQFLNADRLQCKFDRIELKFFHPEEYHCALICSDLKWHVKFSERPEKAMGELSISSLHLQSRSYIFVHPIACRLKLELWSEPWHRLPLIWARVHVNMVQIEFGVNVLNRLKRTLTGYERLMADIREQCAAFNQQFWAQRVDQKLKLLNLKKIKCPMIDYSEKKNRAKEKFQQRAEFYQDDLRAGAFQFVEVLNDNFLPLPYQIQIKKKNLGTICWRYPHPRKICKILISPVPLDCSICIKCRMEYYSEAHGNFMPYCEFALSEVTTKDLKLPQLHVCAYIWRVVILQSRLNKEDEGSDEVVSGQETSPVADLQIDDVLAEHSHSVYYPINPKILVACMRIDSAFSSQDVPKIQCLLSIKQLEVKLLNQPELPGILPPVLQQYKLCSSSKISQAFLECSLKNMNLFLKLHTQQKFSFNYDLTCHSKCIDYGNLHMLELLEECSLQSLIEVNKKEGHIKMNVMADKFRLNFGPTILHTLITSKRHWQDCLSENPEPAAFVSKCVVVNRTRSSVGFGQTGTVERIDLKPRECCMYSFHNEFFGQELTFYITNEQSLTPEECGSASIQLKFAGDSLTQYVRVGVMCLVLQFRKLSATQIYILIQGQIEIISMVGHEFRLEICTDKESAENSTAKPLEFTLEERCRDSVLYYVQRDINLTMRLRFLGEKYKGRSGDIPLRSNKSLPWLVKVPHANMGFISFWVRIMREDLNELSTRDFQPQRLLIIIWPIFELHSTLPHNFGVLESSLPQPLQIAAHDGCGQLDVAATHLTEHKLHFEYDFSLDTKSKCEHVLSLKSIDWNKFFWYDEKLWTIEYALKQLCKRQCLSWPLNDEQEMRLQRACSSATAVSVCYKSKAAQEFSCSICLEVCAWGLFINSTGLQLSVCNWGTQERVTIDSNYVAMLFTINTAFTLELQDGSKCISSMPICFEHMRGAMQEKHYIISGNKNVEITLINGMQLLKFVLELQIDELERHVFVLRSKYCVANFTDKELTVLPFSLPNKDIAQRADVLTYAARLGHQIKRVAPVNSNKNCIGITLDSLPNLKARELPPPLDIAYTPFVSLQISNESDISIPLPMSTAFTRKCFSVQCQQESVPLVAALIENHGIYYLSIFKDVSPGLLLSNHTELQLAVAQSANMENECKKLNILPEFEGKQFVWLQLLSPMSKCYYTPPHMNARFPDVESTLCALTFALYNEQQPLVWSETVRTDKTLQKSLHLPQHGDVKLVICEKHNIVRVSIYYIAEQMEFSVKDLRLRFSKLPTLEGGTISSPNSVEHLNSTEPEFSASATSPVSTMCRHFTEENIQPKLQLQMHIICKEVNFILNTDSKCQNHEQVAVLALSIDDIMISYDDMQRRFQLLFADLQLDNQLFSTGNYDFPVLLCAEQRYERHYKTLGVHELPQVFEELCSTSRTPTGLFTLYFYDDEFKIRCIECRISPVRVYIEDGYINDLKDALQACVPAQCVYQAPKETERITLAEAHVLLPQQVAAQAICIAEPLKLQTFRMHPLSVLLSVHSSVRLYIALDHSPLSFSMYERQQVLSLPLRFGQSLGMHYLSGALFGAGWVVGSLEILGSPSGLARSFTMGLRDFVSMPVRGLFRGPWGFIVGITQGSASLLRNVTAGTVNSVTKLAASVARNLDRMTLDADHIERTEALRRSCPQGFTEGLSQGVTGLGINMLGAVGGIARHTLEARSAGEVVAGVGKGIVGAIAKPLSGAAELVALAGQGMLNTVGFNAMPQQRAHAVKIKANRESSAYRILKLLPEELLQDQILFHHEVTLLHRQKNILCRAYLMLTSTFLTILEAENDMLSVGLLLKNLKLKIDVEERGLVHIDFLRRAEDENLNYTNQRILTFLRSASHNALSPDTLRDPVKSDGPSSHMGWSFYIEEHLAEFIVQYLSILKNDK